MSFSADFHGQVLQLKSMKPGCMEAQGLQLLSSKAGCTGSGGFLGSTLMQHAAAMRKHHNMLDVWKPREGIPAAYSCSG